MGRDIISQGISPSIKDKDGVKPASGCLRTRSSVNTSIDEDYVHALEIYCLLRQRLVDIKHNWKTVVSRALWQHGRHTGKHGVIQ